ncbi:glutathione peroxidase [Neotabrizicola sp. sgz301269]|uniref:glutathione peroxidase n=1 Tax=Neotabrizicola sp. sgz301269 TaxID=3276282 RepID=UPI00376F578C
MNRLHLAALLGFALAPLPALAGFSFDAIDGGKIDLDDWKGHPVLVVNTASLCGFAGQFDDLQKLHEELGPKGVLILAVPSDDFNQELSSDAEVKSYCEMTFDLTLPMTTITPVTGAAAHPFYVWVKEEAGFVPGWNFNKVLLGPDGEIEAIWGSAANPSGVIRERIEALLP